MHQRHIVIYLRSFLGFQYLIGRGSSLVQSIHKPLTEPTYFISEK